jgi:hypothetical protein
MSAVRNKVMMIAGVMAVAFVGSAHAEEQPKLYCYESNQGSQRVTFTRDGGTINMHNELTGKDYQFPIVSDQKAQFGNHWVLIFKAGNEERMLVNDDYNAREKNVTEYTLVRAVNGHSWRYRCYPQPNEHPDSCIDFNGTFVNCADLAIRKERLRQAPPPSAYAQCMSSFLTPDPFAHTPGIQTMDEQIVADRICSQYK